MAFATKHREKAAAEPGPAHRKPQHAPEVPHRTAVGVPVFLQRSSSASSASSSAASASMESDGGSPALAGPAPSSSGHPLFQTPLAVGGVDDPAEHQADAVAAAVTAAPPASAAPSSSTARVAPTAPGAAASSSVLRREPSASPVSTPGARPAVPSSESPLPGHGPGTSMSARTRGTLESRLGVDLGAVRVHRGPAAHEAAAALGARAFAAGSHIWLGRGESEEDVGLMAHETAHVLQQDGVVRRAPAAAPPAGAKKGAPKGDKGGAAKGGEKGGAPPAAAPVPMQMPEPPAGMSADERARLESVQQSNTEVAETAASLPPAEEQTADARGAVTEPAAETEARSQEDVVATLDEREPPSPEIEELCERIRTVIRERRPPNEDRLVEAQPDEMARQAGTQVQGDVQGEADRVAGSYDSMDSPPAGNPEQTGEPLETPAAGVDARPADASGAAPDAVPAENVSLEADTAASAQQIEDAGMNGEVAAEAARGDPDGPIAEARGAQGELAETARRDPAQVMRQQREALSRAEADMAQLQAGALEVLRAARSGTVRSTSGQQAQMVGSEEQMRQQAGERSRALFADAQTRVNALLEPLPRTAMARWDAGKEILAEEFKQSLAEVKRWIDERHAGIGGALVAGLDYLTGLPDWVVRAYDRAEQRFGDGICSLAREISRDVNTAVAACEAIVTEARRQISELFASLPASLQEWARGEQARLGEQLDGLRNRATEARTSLNRDLVQRAGSAVQEAREQIHALRQAAGGLLGRIRDAVGRFLDDPAKFIIDGLLSLVGIDPSAFWALVARVQQVVHDIADNPMGFANNLMRGIAQGFRQFFANIGTHLLNGFMGWLFGGLAAAGITIPRDLSLKSIVTFVLQLMGITWARIRQVLARHVGERNIALLERAYELVSTLIEKGPEGIFEMIQERLNPQQIIDQIIQAGISYLTERLITMVSVRIMGMLNPAGAIAQAIEAIYRVLKWVFENAARIFQFVEAVVGGMAAIVAGNIGGMANAVERALATLIAPVIDFLADYMGFGDLPERIKETIEGFQAWVMGHIDRAVGWLVERARALLARMGIGGQQDRPGQQRPGENQVGETVPFSAAGEGHRLWVQVEGSRATLMVASGNPGAVATRLDDWVNRVRNLPEEAGPEGGEKPRDKAMRLIREARALDTNGDRTAEQLVRATQASAAGPGTAPAQPGAGGSAAGGAGAQLSQQERDLADRLRQLFELFGETGRLNHPIWQLIGVQLVVRGLGDARDARTGPAVPAGYSINAPAPRYKMHIQKTQAPDRDNRPEVHLDTDGKLQVGPARPIPATEARKIEEYQKVLRAAHITTGWPTTEDADEYRGLVRDLVVGQYSGRSRLPALDHDILNPVIVGTQYNRIIGEIFEIWVGRNLTGVVRENAPRFLLKTADGGLQERVADARVEGTDTLVEVKAISNAAPPTTEHRAQMRDYARIVTPPKVAWLRKSGNTFENVFFSTVRYVLNNRGVMLAWKDDLTNILGGALETDPDYRTTEPGDEEE